ncbi:efflux RND transporter periplasmic adaptor subunit [candidate division KSB1 bacterium]|nr:efflux RND transporter periplasmic adaptor subunit [candidate division KSB1 bacterium]
MFYKKPLNILIVTFLLLSCQSKNTGQVNLTFQIQKEDFDANVESEGVVEAVRNHILNSPQLWTGAKISYIVPEGSRVEKGQLVFKLEAEVIQNRYINALDERDVVKAEAEQKYAELELERLLYDAQYRNAMAALKTAELQLTKLEFEPPKIQEIKRLEIKQYELDAERNQQKMKSLEKIQKEERSHMDLLIRQAENKISSLEDNLAMLDVYSPVDGFIIYEVNRRTREKILLGDDVFPGMSVVKIPDMSNMLVKLLIGETEAQKIKKNQKATITIPTIDDLELTGKVSSVDKMAKSIRRGSKVKKVEVIVTLDSVVQDVVPGLSAFCSIEIEKFTDAIKVPLECIYEKDSVKIVYVKSKDHFIPEPIAIVNQNNNFAIIEGELAGMESLALVEPPDSKVRWPDILTAYKLAEPVETDSSQSKPVNTLDSLKHTFNRDKGRMRGSILPN